MKRILSATLFFIGQLAVAGSPTLGDDWNASPENVSPAWHSVAKEQAMPALNYVNQPPLIPHSIESYQVTKNVNQCLQCHSPQNAKVTGAPQISITHFADRQGNLSNSSSPRRYFCLQCHVPQTQAKPIVGNNFQPM